MTPAEIVAAAFMALVASTIPPSPVCHFGDPWGIRPWIDMVRPDCPRGDVSNVTGWAEPVEGFRYRCTRRYKL